jgi:ribonuclease D
MSEDQRDRLELLMDWRKRTALERGVSSDVVLHKETLFEIARCNPVTDEDLGAIEGLGPARRALYGGSILAALQESAGSESRV